MTWVFGNATILGSGVCVADIQVTTGDRTFDCLRKLYPLDRNLIAGFAGNVATGFEMLAVLHHLMNAEKASSAEVANVQRIFKRFPTSAKQHYASLSAEHHEGGSQLLIVGANHAADALYESRPDVARFTAPDFRCDEIPRGTWGSIGSGTGIDAYRKELAAITGDEGRQLMQLEVGQPGGYAKTMSFVIVEAVRKMPPVCGISQHFHTGIVTAHACEFRSSATTWHDDEGPHVIEMPEVAESWASLQALLLKLGAGQGSGEAIA